VVAFQDNLLAFDQALLPEVALVDSPEDKLQVVDNLVVAFPVEGNSPVVDSNLPVEHMDHTLEDIQEGKRQAVDNPVVAFDQVEDKPLVALVDLERRQFELEVESSVLVAVVEQVFGPDLRPDWCFLDP
jgi:hypothetical protein